MFTIRKAVPNDAKIVLELIKELAVYERQPDAVITTESDIVEQAFSDYPLIYIHVAEVDHQVVGMALYYYTFSTWKGKSIHLEDLIVREEYRKLGIGKALMNQVIKIAHDENVGRLQWDVLDWNDPAIKFYESLGTTFYKDWWLCRLFRDDIKRLSLKD